MKKIFSRFSLLMVAAAVVVAAVMPAGVAQAFSTSYYDAAKTAELKLYYNNMRRCLNSNQNRTFNEVDARDAKLFIGDSFGAAGATDNNRGLGGWLENTIAGKYEDGKITCGENNSEIIKKFAQLAGVSLETLLCGPDVNNPDAGIIERIDGSKTGDCKSFADGGMGSDYRFRKPIEQSKAYLGKVFGEALQKYIHGDWGPNNNWASPTSAEWYYLNLNTFKNACGFESSDSPNKKFENIALFSNNGGARIVTFKPYQGDNSFDRSVLVYGSEGTENWSTCSELAKALGPDSTEFKEAQKLKYAEINNKCKTDEGYEKILTDKKTNLQATLDNPDANQADKDSASALITRISQIIANNDYISYVDDSDHTKGVQCRQDADLGLAGDYTKNCTTDPDMAECKAAENACHDNAGSMGWVACPVQDALVGAVNNLYKGIAEQFLVVDAQAFANNSPTSDAWGRFRDIANIMFVILFIVVIISQVTGFGISNYGIKKMLPRLIIAALLINLSYIVCQLAVDLSNIIGSTLVNFLAEVVPSGTDNGGLAAVVGILGTALALVTIGGVAATAVGGVAVLVPVLLFLLSLVLAVLMLFVILTVRKALVILLVVVSPIAFVCYTLPNTNTIFKKWFNIFKTMLLVYPICSLVVGAGVLAHNILYQNVDKEDFMMNVAGLVVAVFPFFFIPSILKSSMAALGALGAKINGVGGKIGSWGAGQRRQATGAGKKAFQYGSDNTRFGRWRKNQRAVSTDKKIIGRANKDIAKLEGRDDLSHAQKAQLDSAYKSVAKVNPDVGMSEHSKQWEEAYKSGDTSQLKTLTRRGRELWGDKFINSMGSSIASAGHNENSLKSLATLQSMTSTDKAFSGDLERYTPDVANYVRNASSTHTRDLGAEDFNDISAERIAGSGSTTASRFLSNTTDANKAQYVKNELQHRNAQAATDKVTRTKKLADAISEAGIDIPHNNPPATPPSNNSTPA
jgi:hypothetical protein